MDILRKTGKILLCVALVLLHSLSLAQDFTDVSPDYRPKFPGDFFYKKDFRIQWWYFTGHLTDKDGREFGYELTFFVVGVQKREYTSQFGVDNIYISHFAVSDVGGKKFYYADMADSGAFRFSGADAQRLRVWVGENRLEGGAKTMQLSAFDKDKALAIDLDLEADTTLVLNGEGGYSRKSEESPAMASIYFSYPSMKTEGRLRIGNRSFAVSGKSWFDREFSSRELGKNQAGWDWFAIQLEDNREIMLYEIRNKNGSSDRYSSGTFVYPDGAYRHLSKDDYSITALDHYKSEHTGAHYPSKWKIAIPSENISLVVTPLIKDQELVAARSTGNYYWEGTCEVTGNEKGRAYVELTGY